MFGCGEASFRGEIGFQSEFARAAFAPRADRLRHADGLDRDAIDWSHEERLRSHTVRLGAAGLFGALGPRDPLARSPMGGTPSDSGAFSGGGPTDGGGGGGNSGDVTLGLRSGRVHTIPSTSETVRLGVFDSTLENVVDIDPGDVISYPNTWSHFLNRLQPGASIDELARLRRENPGRGPHSIIGPVGVRGAQPGDTLAIHFERLTPVDWGATFVNPAELGTGTLPDAFPAGQARYLTLDTARMHAEFLPGIMLPLAPFQGTFAVAPAEVGVVSSVPPGQHAGNIDLRDLTEGSTLYLPVWQPLGKLYTGDSHATQGDGEVNNQALESAMREVRVRVELHKTANAQGWAWPFAETAEHWIALGIDPDLNQAFRIATRNTIDFLHRRAGLEPMDAYSLASIGVSFRVTQFVNIARGVHALIPKALFSAERRQTIAVV